jgi:hypothetical protein
MTGAAQARGLRRARKLRALRLISSRTAAAQQVPDRGPLTADEVRQLWLSWGGLTSVDVPAAAGAEQHR